MIRLVCFATLVASLPAQDCGAGGSCHPKPATETSQSAPSGCCQSMEGVEGPLTRAHAELVAEQVRGHVCASISKVELQNHLAFVQDGDVAELLAARIREASDVGGAVDAIFAMAEERRGASKGVEFAAKLSEAGFYGSTREKIIGAGFVPYVINSPLWSDGAKKDRFVRVPKGTKISFRAASEWDFPVGTTFLQTMYFTDGDAKTFTETRVIVRGEDELHFASYAWDDEGQDAELVDEFGDDLYANHGDVSQLWSIAAREDCVKCHNQSVQGRTLGFTTAQMNRVSTDGKTNQLTLFASKGILDGVPAKVDELPAMTDPRDESASLADRARSYLATNCSSCHRPGGPGSGTLDLRLETALEHTGLLRKGIVRAGRPRYSRILGRMRSIDWDRMPSLLSTVPDDEGMAMLAKWIEKVDPALRHVDKPKVEETCAEGECCIDGADCCEGAGSDCAEGNGAVTLRDSK